MTAGSTSTPLLRIEGLAVRFATALALDAVDVEVRSGELVGLAGENGAGKSTLVRCIAGDIAPDAGSITVGGRAIRPTPRSSQRAGVAVVWQDLSLCDNLDVAGNLLLGRERRRSLLSDTRFHAAADLLLHQLGIPLAGSGRPVAQLSGGQRQLVAVARAMRDRPSLLVLDEPTASLGVAETAQVERLILRLRDQGTTVVVVSHDVAQLVRLADRIVVLRHGRVASELDAATAHADDVVAAINGQAVEGSARRQLTRLRSLAGRLAAAEPSSSLDLILSALVAAIGAEAAAIHLLEGGRLEHVAAIGQPERLARALGALPVGAGGGPVGVAAASGAIVVEPEVGAGWPGVGDIALTAGARACLSVPVRAPEGLHGVVTVFLRAPGRPGSDEVDLVTLYASYVASAVERDRLLAERTARTGVLEALREVLERLAGPVPILGGPSGALAALQEGLGATGVALHTQAVDGSTSCRAGAGEYLGLAAAAGAVLGGHPVGDGIVAVRFDSPAGPAALLAAVDGTSPVDRTALLGDAARSLRLALEREEAERAQQEATALRRSKELHQRFLSRLSHELRTPLTAIHGYATSLMAPDVAWDRPTEERFLSRISSESGRLARLVDDLLDSSAIESGTLRLQPDWCDLSLVLDSARACLPLERSASVRLDAAGSLPAVWADHDRLEQVFVNLMDNAVRHNPPGTSVDVAVRTVDGGGVAVTIVDDGVGFPDLTPDGVTPRRPTSGSGLGLSIARGIVEAHGGSLSVARRAQGTTVTVVVPVEHAGAVVDA